MSIISHFSSHLQGFPGIRAYWTVKLFLRRPLHKVVYCIVYRTSVSCSRQGLVAWESTWLRQTRSSSLTLTGTPRTTCRHKPELTELVRRSRLVERHHLEMVRGGRNGGGSVSPSRMFAKCFFSCFAFISLRIDACLLISTEKVSKVSLGLR